jgi:hypothetical protein|tara:strand:+ start:1044 stop:1679 length:636 start_codon:yes stop_codon:yes gene_type:complete
MATVEPKSMATSLATPAGQMFTVDIAQAAFGDAETTAGGRLSPCHADDFATAPSTLAQSLLVSRGLLRFKLMMNNLQIRSNVQLANIVTTYGSDAGDSPITDLNFTLIFENADFVPTTGTTIDGSTTTTNKAEYIRDKIAEALNANHTEKMSVFNPTSGAGDVQDTEVTVAQVMIAEGEIVEAITVTEITTFRPNTANQTPTDSALTYSAE